MKKDCFLKAAKKVSGFLSTNILLVISLTLVGDEKEDLSTAINSVQELMDVDANILLKQSKSVQDIQLPVPVFDPKPLKSSFITVSLSGLLPGLGHMYLGDLKTGGGLMSIAGLSLGCSSYQPSRYMSFVTAQNLWFYGIYAGYRDVRIYNKQSGYSYKMPMDSLADLASAPFNWSILKKPEVWGGLLGKFALILATAYLFSSREAPDYVSKPVRKKIEPLISFPVGVGEEALFRGFLQSQLSEIFNPWAGITLSSLAFGAAHLSNARGFTPEHKKEFYALAIPLITLGGAYYGWLTHKNNSLQESVALHTWYDFILIALGSLAGETIITGRSNFAIAIPF